jgi:hypothetical protein
MLAAMDQSSVAQNRRSGRSPVLLSATIRIADRDVPVVLRNLSSQGALIEGAQLPPQDTETLFTRKELTVKGRIVWVEGRYAGLAFDRRLDREELLRHVPKPRQRVEQLFRRPGLAIQPLSEADRKMVQMWMAPPALRRD